MTPFRIKITIQANRDLENIYRYIFDILQSPIAAEKTLSALQKAIASLTYFPERCPVVNLDIKEPVVRKLLVNKYIVFYRTMYDLVTVLRVLHSSANLEGELRYIDNID